MSDGCDRIVHVVSQAWDLKVSDVRVIGESHSARGVVLGVVVVVVLVVVGVLVVVVVVVVLVLVVVGVVRVVVDCPVLLLLILSSESLFVSSFSP